jgi:uncharacterized membrane protein (DUF485 family)
MAGRTGEGGLASDPARVAADPRYIALTRRRGRLGAGLAVVMIAAYFGFILLIAFDKALLGTPVAGGATTLGIPLGIGLLLLAVALTGVYVRRANAEFDALTAAIRAEHGR